MLNLKLIFYTQSLFKLFIFPSMLSIAVTNTYAENTFKSYLLDILPQYDIDKSKKTSVIDNQKIILNTINNKLDISTSQKLNIYQAVELALQTHPEISEKIFNISRQNSYIRQAMSGYYPQLSGSLSSGDIGSKNLFDQVGIINANQMVYDFGKTRTSVNIEEVKTQIEYANLLDNIEDLSQKVVINIINIRRYQALFNSAQKQIKGMQRISEIAKLRAEAGISSQADPVQTQSYLQSAQTYAIAQQNQLQLYQQRLNTLLGQNANHIEWEIPETLLTEAHLFKDVELTRLPKMRLANAELELVKLQQQEIKLSTYPTIQLKGELSQAVNRRHPNTGERNGFDSSIAFEANSRFYQGGSTSSQIKALQYAQDAAHAKLNRINIEIQEQIQLARQDITFKNKQMNLLLERAQTTAQTQDLYEEQYKLGTRTVLDLLNSEQSIHSAAQEIENTRYDIFEQLVNYISATGQSRQVYHFTSHQIQGLEIVP